ncbi:MAG TPA: RidA family protein [Sporolactobacillaceae bacterium]|nr:RidA family protein [Sporolactobacillaceae bacterium]
MNPESMPTPFGYSHVVEVRNGRTVYVSGQIALTKEGDLVGNGDLRLQTKQVFENIKSALNAVGLTFNDVVKLTFYLLDISKMQDVRDIRDEYINTVNPPVSSAVEVRKLIRDDFLIEIDAIAVGD